MFHKTMVLGRLGTDPELKTVGDKGTYLCKFTVGANTPFKKQDGSWDQKTEWYKCIAWGNAGKRVGEMSKGDVVFIEGEMETRSWEDQQGQKKFITELKVVKVISLKPKSSTPSFDSEEEIPF